MTKLKSIPCNIITGFLGVGKTTTILNLLKQKPAHEKWAVLVNEFGEIGLDGALLESSQENGHQVFIKEIPGGCMCCASGLPMQIALNMLLMKAKPDRLLIEPTGLGHPKEVIKVLSGEHYQDILKLENTLTLIDARHFSSQKHLDNQTFQQQLEVADLLVANKADLYKQKDIEALEDYLSGHTHLKIKPYFFIQKGELDVKQLGSEKRDTKQKTAHDTCHEKHDHDSSALMNETPDIPSCGYLVKMHKEAEFTSVGWRFKTDIVFDLANIGNWINTLGVKRLKAILKTKSGFVALNLSADDLGSGNIDKTQSLKDQAESRLEIIFEGQKITQDMVKIWTSFLMQ